MDTIAITSNDARLIRELRDSARRAQEAGDRDQYWAKAHLADAIRAFELRCSAELARALT